MKSRNFYYNVCQHVVFCRLVYVCFKLFQKKKEGMGFFDDLWAKAAGARETVNMTGLTAIILESRGHNLSGNVGLCGGGHHNRGVFMLLLLL